MPSPQSHTNAPLRAVAPAALGLVLLGASALAGCSWVPPILSPNFNWTYKIDIQQGVVVTQEMVAQLRPGLTQDQVKFVMGSPPLVDPFHADRWDYPYLFLPGRGPIEERRYTVYFENGKMVRSGGDPLPTEKEFVASRIRINSRSGKALPDPSEKHTAPEPGTAENSAGAPSQPASTGADPSAAAGATATNAGNATSPSLWQRITGLFGGSSNSGSGSGSGSGLPSNGPAPSPPPSGTP